MAESTRDFKEFDFSGAMQDLQSGLLVKPVLHNYLYDARFPDFDLHFAAQRMDRAPDDWFHPSSHPLLPPRLLYEYLSNPKSLKIEKKQYMGTLAVTMGKVVHEFVQMSLTDAGIMPVELQVCTMCPPKAKCHEAGVMDPVLGERGHMDGILDFSGFPNISEDKVNPILEFKTSHDNFGRLTNVADLDLDAFKTKWPGYYAQVQRYMKMRKSMMTIVLMMETVYPFVMREYHIPFDFAFNYRIDQKYQSVRQAVADHNPPICCGLKGCSRAIACGVIR